MNKNVILCIVLLFLGQIVVWYQLNSQLVWDWAKTSKSMWFMSIMGIPISILFWRSGSVFTMLLFPCCFTSSSISLFVKLPCRKFDHFFIYRIPKLSDKANSTIRKDRDTADSTGMVDPLSGAGITVGQDDFIPPYVQ